MKTIKSPLALLSLILLLLGACEKEYSYTLPPKAPPKTSQPTSTLEAAFTTKPPITLNDAYWKTANYLNVSAQDISKNLLYGDGGLNLTGTFNGLLDFSKGKAPGLTLKAAYDNEYLYILAEWMDTTVDVSDKSFLFNSNTDPKKPSESNLGWTAQRNGDKLSFAFDIDGATGASGTFASTGCQASCHGSGSAATMTPTSGNVDLWNWSLATSNPLGYAHDLVSNSTGMVADLGGPLAVRNTDGTGLRAGAKYEWDGTPQSVTLPSGATTLLDPTYYLLNKTVMPGNIHDGETTYATTCEHCHGPNGIGGEYSAINGVGSNKKSREAYKTAMDNVGDMGGYWGPLTSTQKDDIVTFLRGISGAPGYYLVQPTPGTSTADVTVISNVTPTQIANSMGSNTNKHQKYQVLIKRKLKTNNTDDVQFDLGTKRTYIFGVAIMDNDGRNHVGSLKETLTFK